MTTPVTTRDEPAVVSDIGRRYLRLQLTANIGPIRVRSLLNHFGSIEAVLSASRAELERVERIGPRSAEALFTTSDDVVDREIEKAAAHGLRILCTEDSDYPALLRRIPDPPICIYVRGALRPTDAVAVALVGTRRCSHYGREQAIRFSEMLAGAGFTIVSGLARGIDGYAHRGAINGGGRTVAVLGNGLPDIYPPEHKSLADEIAASGAVISECPVGTNPDAENFPRRNRIIVGLSLGVMVVEAGRRSGALISARLANEYNREVFALPGRVDRPEQTAGVHALIRDSQAKLVTGLDDVLDELDRVGEIMRKDLQAKATPLLESNEQEVEATDRAAPDGAAGPPLSRDERVVYEVVRSDTESPDLISETTGLDASRVMATLTALQLKGLVRQLPGNRFVPRSTDSHVKTTR